MSVERGIYIFRVCADSAAQEIKLRDDPRRVPTGRADIITAVDGGRVDGLADMVSYLNTLDSGDQVTLTILRDDKEEEVRVTLAEWQPCR